MTDDKLIQMAKEAFLPYEYKTGLPLYIPQLRRLAEMVAAAAKAEENEACAKVCEEYENDMGYGQPQKCANAIRARNIQNYPEKDNS